MLSVVRDGIFAATVALMFYGKSQENPCAAYVLVPAFFIVDMFMAGNTVTLRIHHLATVGLIAYDYAYFVEDSLRTALLNMELSSVLLTALPYVPARYKGFADLLFYLLFAKTRLFDLYPFLKEVETCMDAGVWILYLLSVYWFAAITRKVSKPFLAHIALDDSYFHNNLFLIHHVSFATNLFLSTETMFVSFLLHCVVFTTGAKHKYFTFALIPIMYDTLQFTDVSVPIVVFLAAILATQQIKPFYNLTFIFDNFLFTGLFYSRL